MIPSRCSRLSTTSPLLIVRYLAPVAPTTERIIAPTVIGSACVRRCRRNHRQVDITRLTGSVVNALRRLHVVTGFREEDVRYERLRITVVQRKERRLHLNHDPVSGFEDVVGRRQREGKRQRLVWREGLRTF